MAHNNQTINGRGGRGIGNGTHNQIVNGRGVREMEEEIEGGDNKGNNGSRLCDVACKGLGKSGNGYGKEEEGSS
jgi:hypothetical protein